MANIKKIRDALAQLKNSEDSHWTEDGLPRIDVVQKLASDGDIKRADISAALPGFARKEGSGGVPAAAPAASAAVAEMDVAPQTEADGGAESEYLTEDEVRAVLDQNVREAQATLEAARQKIRDGQSEERAAMALVARANADRQRAFPAITPMDNIKAHLASEHAKRVAAANGVMPQRVDMAFAAGNSRGWRRPVRPAMGPNGTLVMPVTRERKTFPQVAR